MKIKWIFFHGKNLPLIPAINTAVMGLQKIQFVVDRVLVNIITMATVWSNLTNVTYVKS